MSNERWVRIPSAENLRFPEEGSSAQGKSGPKPRLRSVGDGQRVESPVPLQIVIPMGRRRKFSRACDRKKHVQAPSPLREANPP